MLQGKQRGERKEKKGKERQKVSPREKLEKC